MTIKDWTGRLARLALFLQEFEFEIEYKRAPPTQDGISKKQVKYIEKLNTVGATLMHVALAHGPLLCTATPKTKIFVISSHVNLFVLMHVV